MNIPSNFHQLPSFSSTDTSKDKKSAGLGGSLETSDSVSEVGISSLKKQKEIEGKVKEQQNNLLNKSIEQQSGSYSTSHSTLSIEISEECLKNYVSNFIDQPVAFFDDFNTITHFALKLMIMEKCAVEQPKLFCENLNQFEINSLDEETRFKLAKDCLELTASEESVISKFHHYIAKFNFTNLDYRMHLAECLAQKTCIGSSIRCFSLSDSKVEDSFRVKLFKLSIQYNPTQTANNAKYFYIKDQSERLKLAYLFIEQTAKATSLPYFSLASYLANFELDGHQSEEVLEHSARLLPKEVIKEIKKIKNLSPDFRSKLALICAEKVPLLGNIEHFHILDLEVRSQIALSDAERVDISPHIRKYAITDQDVLSLILERYLEKKQTHVFRNYEQFNILDENVSLKLAFNLSQLCFVGGYTLKKFKIQNEEHRFKIAFSDAQRDNIAGSLNHYEITNQAKRIQLARESAKHPYDNHYEWIDKFGFQDQQLNHDLKILYLKYNPTEYSFLNLSHSPYKECQDWIKLDSLSTEQIQEFTHILTQFIEKEQDSNGVSVIGNKAKQLIQFEELLKKIESNQSVEVKKELLSWLAYTMTILYPTNYSLDFPLEAILDLRDMDRRYQLSSILYTDFLEQNQIEQYKQMTPHPRLKLPALFLLQLNEAEKIKDLIECLKQKTFLKDGYFLGITLQTLNALIANRHLTQDEKTEVLLAAFASTKKDVIKQNLFILQTICKLNEVHLLQSSKFQQSNCDFNQIMQVILHEKLPVQNQDESFKTRYEKKFDSCRQPSSILVYATQLNSIEDEDEKEKALYAFSTYISSVLDETFQDQRYQTPHLDEVFTLKKNLKENWITGVEHSLEIKLNEKQPLNYLEFFKTRILVDKHLGDNLEIDYSRLKTYLETRQKIEYIGELNPKEVIQNTLIQLIQSEREDKADRLKLIYQLRQEIDQVDSKYELLNDLKFLELELNKKRPELKDLKIVDTDHYWDLMMCGTDVVGSCQRVDGDVSFNIGLLAYLMDGKNRLLAIKNKEGKIIARAILRVLINTTTNQPALMMEKIYSNDSRLEPTLINFAKERAHSLELDLFTDGDESISLVSKAGNLAPQEYVDSVGGLQQNGVFTIDQGSLLQATSFKNL